MIRIPFGFAVKRMENHGLQGEVLFFVGEKQPGLPQLNDITPLKEGLFAYFFTVDVNAVDALKVLNPNPIGFFQNQCMPVRNRRVREDQVGISVATCDTGQGNSVMLIRTQFLEDDMLRNGLQFMKPRKSCHRDPGDDLSFRIISTAAFAMPERRRSFSCCMPSSAGKRSNTRSSVHGVPSVAGLTAVSRFSRTVSSGKMRRSSGT